MLARAGHCVYASMRLNAEHGPAHAEEARQLAARENVDLRVVELDVLSEASCRAAVDQVLGEQGRIDVVVNNAGMLMVGVTEAFVPEQLTRIFDTNAISWLRVNRAVLPAMRRQGRGVLVYVSSTTAHIFEPFIGPYVASKAAGEALAEAMGLEVSRSGIETVIVVPGAFTSGTEHFAHAQDNLGCWSHKPGQTVARNVDNAGNQITDPQHCDRGPYSDLCGFMVTKRTNTIS